MRPLATVLLLLLFLSPLGPAGAADGSCIRATLHEGKAGCLAPGADTLTFVAENPGHHFEVDRACSTDNHICPRDTPSCVKQGLTGEVYNVFEDGVRQPWQACLSQDQADQINGITPGFVERAFKRLTWPASGLVVQPPHGRTLVNLDTNFYTTNTAPTTQTITLLGQRLRIEATPSEYTWHFGAGEPDQTTADPGAPYPDLRVTHRYLTVGTVTPSVDTTYTGRYRVNGGDWQTIPDTLTVPGPVVTLQVLSATPHLVGR